MPRRPTPGDTCRPAAHQAGRDNADTRLGAPATNIAWRVSQLRQGRPPTLNPGSSWLRAAAMLSPGHGACFNTVALRNSAMSSAAQLASSTRCRRRGRTSPFRMDEADRVTRGTRFADEVEAGPTSSWAKDWRIRSGAPPLGTHLFVCPLHPTYSSVGVVDDGVGGLRHASRLNVGFAKARGSHRRPGWVAADHQTTS